MTSMVTRSYTVKFLTPAFLGNAEQDGAWRTPPFKALLRQWWRVAVASACKFNVDAVRAREAELFGSASDGEGSRSLVRIRLDSWHTGKLDSWQGLETARVAHPEVKSSVGSQLYLGYGPLNFAQGGTALKKTGAIKPGDSATLKLAFPSRVMDEIDTALWLMDRYGTLGGRSRNAWGSFSLKPTTGKPTLASHLDSGLVSDWKQALERDWPHAIGLSDGRPLVWTTAPQPDWSALMKKLAELKIGLRTQFRFTSGKNAHSPEDRHWLSYPVTNHSVSGWRAPGKGDFRLPNSLRFKVRESQDNRVHGVIVHVPCLPPTQFSPDRKAVEIVWNRVHGLLDQLCKPAPERIYDVPDRERLLVLKPLLDGLSLSRVIE